MGDRFLRQHSMQVVDARDDASAESENHVNSEVAIAQWQYYLATLDRD